MTVAEYEKLSKDQGRDIHDDCTVAVFFLQFPSPWRTQITSIKKLVPFRWRVLMPIKSIESSCR